MASRFTERFKLKAQTENPNTHHMIANEALSLGMHISHEDKMIFACLSTQYMLLTPAYAVEAELWVDSELNEYGTGDLFRSLWTFLPLIFRL